MKILIYGINYWPELTGIGKYSGELSEWLSNNKHHVRVITSPPYYPDWEVKKSYKKWFYQKQNRNGVVIFRAPIFVPKRPTTITRLLHLISFSISSLPLVIRHVFWKPDVVFFVQPTLFAALGAIFIAKLSGAKSVMHIQDYEIDAMLGLGMFKHGLLSKSSKKIESWLMSRFDIISTISYGMMVNAESKGIQKNKLVFFPNWADTEFVTHRRTDSVLKAEWGFSDEDRIILYAGNVGEKQGLELVLDAAENLKDKQSLKFVIVGTGVHVDVLQDIATRKKLHQVYFKPLQPWELVPDMLAMADIHLVVQKRGAADVVLPSKLTNILSIGGHTLVTAEKDTELGLLARRFPGIYKCIDPEDSTLFTESLLAMLESDLRQPNIIARNYAVKYLSKNNILSDFENNLKKLVAL